MHCNQARIWEQRVWQTQVRKKVLPSWKVSGWLLPSRGVWISKTPLEWSWWWHLDSWNQSTPHLLFSSVCKTDWDCATSGNLLKSAAICLEFDQIQKWWMGFYLSKGGCKQLEHLDTWDLMWLHGLSILAGALKVVEVCWEILSWGVFEQQMYRCAVQLLTEWHSWWWCGSLTNVINHLGILNQSHSSR